MQVLFRFQLQTKLWYCGTKHGYTGTRPLQQQQPLLMPLTRPSACASACLACFKVWISNSPTSWSMDMACGLRSRRACDRQTGGSSVHLSKRAPRMCGLCHTLHGLRAHKGWQNDPDDHAQARLQPARCWRAASERQKAGMCMLGENMLLPCTQSRSDVAEDVHNATHCSSKANPGRPSVAAARTEGQTLLKQKSTTLPSTHLATCCQTAGPTPQLAI